MYHEKYITMNIKGKNAIVTGGGRGLGKAVALALANEGVNVAVTGRNEENLKNTVEEIRNTGVNAAYAVFSVDSESEVKTGIESLAEQLGGIDILINNAGIGVQAKNFEELSEEELDRLIGVNIKGVYFGCQAVIPHMKKNGFGVIINTASASGLRPRTGNAMYSTTKGAVITLTKALAIELAPFGIRVTGVNPVAVKTNVLTQLMGEKGSESHRIRSERMINSIPLGRLATPDDIANAMVFLASEEAALVTGSFIDVDGGRGI